VVAAGVYVLVFRLIHILGGIFWVGSVALFTLFVAPAAAEVGPGAGPLVANLVVKRRVVRFIVAAGATTIVAGGFMYWHEWDAAGSLGAFLETDYGRALTSGAVLAVIAFAIGVSIVMPGVEDAVRLGSRMAASNGAPGEGIERFQALQTRNRRASRTVLTLLVLSSAAMATAQAW
jgi:uncharacterized membrane protein